MTDAAKVLVLGADGFIGRHIAFGLRAAGWDVLAHARGTGRLQAMGFDTLRADLARPECTDPDFWRTRLSGVTHIVNAAGVLTAPPAWYHAIHVMVPDTIYQALPSDVQGVLISAVGIDDADTDFARYRREGEDVAKRHGITVLRAGLVMGDTSYGGTSLARGLAATPGFVPVVGDGTQPFNPVHASDLANVVNHLLSQPPASQPLEIGGPEIVNQADMMRKLRGWLGLRRRPVVGLPLGFATAIGRLGDLMRLGPISATAVAQLQSGVLAKPSDGLPPVRGFSEFLNARPAGTQDLWHARLYMFRPVLRLVLAALWLVSGLLGLFLPASEFLPLLPGTSLPDGLLTLLARLGGVLDIGIAAALVLGWRPRMMAWIQLVIVLGYTATFTWLNLGLWLLPLGGLLKNLPILALIWIAAILEEER